MEIGGSYFPVEWAAWRVSTDEQTLHVLYAGGASARAQRARVRERDDSVYVVLERAGRDARFNPCWRWASIRLCEPLGDRRVLGGSAALGRRARTQLQHDPWPGERHWVELA
jgi:hypothetical protein